MTEPTPEATYVLETVSGRPLPAPFYRTAGRTLEMLSDALTLPGDGTFALRGVARFTDVGEPRAGVRAGTWEEVREQAGRWDRVDGPGGPEVRCAAAGHVLPERYAVVDDATRHRASEEGRRWVYRRAARPEPAA